MYKLGAAHRLKVAHTLTAAVDSDALNEFADLIKCLDSVRWQKFEDKGYFDSLEELCMTFDADSYDALYKRLLAEGYKEVAEVNVSSIECLATCPTGIVLGYGSGARCPLVCCVDDEHSYLYMPTGTDDVQQFVSSLG
jgi:hypothetical protein